MKATDIARQPICVPTVPGHRLVYTVGASLIMIALFHSCGDVSLCSAAAQSDGALLFQKHCSVCHPDVSLVNPSVDILGTVRKPPPGMPVFGEDKLTDLDARMIGAYLHSVVPGGPPAATAVTEPITQDPERTNSGTETPPRAGKSAKEKKAWIRSFGTPED